MGEYVYSLRKQKIQIEIFDKMVSVNFFSYLCKPYYGSGGLDRRSAMLVGRALSVWNKTPLPEYVVQANRKYFEEPRGNFTPLYAVYKNPRSIVWFDNGPFKGEHIGYIEVCVGTTPVFHDLETSKKIHENNYTKNNGGLIKAF